MGRKIPGRKHRGVRDPEKQAAIKFNSIKDKINAPPTNPEDQEIPKTLQKIIDLKNKIKSGDFNFKRKKKTGKSHEKTRMQNNDKHLLKNKNKKHNLKPERPIPRFKQLPGEGDRQFLNRVNKITQNVIKEVAFEEKYGVEIKRNKAGQVEEVVKRPKDELELLLKKVQKEKKDKQNKKKKASENQSPKLTKSQKWQRKKKEKKLKKNMKNKDDLETRKDEVKFGETVHAPPKLVAPKKVVKLQNTPRPGRKNLLLKTMFERGDTNAQKPSVKKSIEVLHKTSNKAINKKGKRRDLPNALRRQLDRQQQEIINNYKLLKSKKYSIN